MLHLLLMGSDFNELAASQKRLFSNPSSVRCPSYGLPSSPPLLSFSLWLIYPVSRPWGGAALGRLLTQEKRAFNVVSLCCKVWQTKGPGHLLEEINTLPSSFAECNGLDITSPVGHYSPRIINPPNNVHVCVCAHTCIPNVECVCGFTRVWCICVCHIAVEVSKHSMRQFVPLRESYPPFLHLVSWKQSSSCKSQLHEALLSTNTPPPTPTLPCSLATGDNGQKRLLAAVFQGLPLASDWVWEGTAK